MSDNAKDYADSLAETFNRRAESGSPFGHIDENEEWHDFDDCPTDCEQIDASAYDYLEGVLDINYIINSDKTYKGARILIAFGGPTAWIDTNTGQLEAAWWSATEYRNLPSEFVNGLDDALEELYGC